MALSASRRIIYGVASLLPSAARVTGRRAEPKKSDYLGNIALCNGSDRTSLAARIDGCTALIDSGQGTTTALPSPITIAATRYTAKGDFDRAIPDFDQSIKLDPAYAKPFNNRGAAYLRKGEYDLALKAFDQAIKLNPNYGRAFVNRAEVYLKKNEYDRAAGTTTRPFALSPIWKPRGADAAGPGPFSARCKRRSRTATRCFSRGRTTPRPMTSRGLIHLKMGQARRGDR